MHATRTTMLIVHLGAFNRRPVWLAIADFNAASRACRSFIEALDLGASQWRGGRIVDADTKELVATVSYNGRVWLPDGSEARDGKTIWR